MINCPDCRAENSDLGSFCSKCGTGLVKSFPESSDRSAWAWTLGVAGLVFCCVVVLLAIGLVARTRRASLIRQPPQVSAGSGLKGQAVTASGISMLYRQDPIAADRRFKNRQVLVVGKVESTGRDTDGTAFVRMTSELGPPALRFMFSQAAEARLNALNEKSTVLILANCRGETASTVVFLGSQLLEKW